MSMKVGTGMSQYYDVSRLSRTSDIDRTSRVGQKEAADSLQNNSRNGSQYISQDHGGVIQTRVSDANAYQKNQIDTNRQTVEKMAEKLMSKLPDILKDMQSIPQTTAQTETESRVAVNERNAALVAERQQQDAAALQNFSL